MPIVLHRVNSCFSLREKYSIEVIFVHSATGNSFREAGLDAIMKEVSEVMDQTTDLQFLSEVCAAFCSRFCRSNETKVDKMSLHVNRSTLKFFLARQPRSTLLEFSCATLLEVRDNFAEMVSVA